MGKNSTITIRVEKSVKDRLDLVAKQLNRSKSYLAGEAIEEFVSIQEWQIRGIEDAIQTLDNHQGIAHSDVRDWVQSWDTDRENPKPE